MRSKEDERGMLQKWVCSRGRCERVFCREMEVLLRYGRGVFDQKWVRCKEVGEKIQKGRERLLIGYLGLYL